MKRHNRFLTCVVLSALLCGGFGMASAADTAVGSGAGVAYGTGSSAPKAENVAIGKNAKIAYSGGVGQPSTGDIVIGGGAHTNNYIDQGGGIAIGANAFVENMVGGLERAFDFNQARYDSIFGIPYGLPKDPSKMVTGVAIGQNTYARSGSVMLGTHNYKGALGDTEVDSANAKADNMSLFSTTVGANSYTNGLFSSITGSYSIASSDYNGGATNAVKNFGATITGSLNSIESKTASSDYSGIASSIIGVANRVYNSNGALVFGAGNEITNSVTDVNGLSSGGASAKELQNTLKDMIKEANGGGSTLAIGGGNKADYTLLTQISGVNNTITGTADKSAQLNSITGFQNTITNASNNIVMGDKHTVTADNTIAIGGLSEAETRSAANTTSVGYDAKVSQEGGVALGYQSNAAIDKGAAGYDISTNAASSDTTVAWKSTAAAVSVGDVDKGITRQITSVAAGTNDTDAVNVAQLKKAMNSASAPSTHYYSIRSNEQGDGSNYNNDGATGREALAAGVNASAQGEKSTAIGYGTKTTARNTVAIGNGSQAIGKSGIAIGDGATAGSPDSNYLYGNIAIGTGANSAGGVAIGDDTKAGSFSLAVGINSEAGERAAAVGYSNYATGILSSALGVGNTASATTATAVGNSNTVSGERSAAIGMNNTVAQTGTYVLGSNVTTTQKYSVVLGAYSKDRAATNETKGTITLSDGTTRDYGNFAGSKPFGIVSVGYKDGERQIINVAAGKISADSTDAVNGSQLYSLAGEVGKNADAITNINTKIDNVAAASTHYYSVKSSDQGDGSNYNNDGATGRNALAAGVNASAKGFESTAIGYGAKSTQDNAVAIGNGSQSIGKNGIAIGTGAVAGSTGSNYLYGNIAIGAGANSAGGVAIGDNSKAGNYSLAAGLYSEAGDRAAAVGYSNKATGQWSSALGVGNEASALSSTAVGNGNKVSGEGSAAVGVGNKVAQKDTFVLGSNVTTTQANSVVLGANSTDRAATSETKGTITLSDGTTREYGNFAGTSPTGVVSVGDTGKERQIINVAAGKISADSTDAVNGSQLYSLAGEVGKNADAIKNLNTQITNVTSEAGKHTTVKAGNNKNLTVTEGTNAAGGKEYTVDLSENINIGGPGKDGKDGQDGHMGINGKDGVSGVGIDGKDGISVKGDKGEVGINGNDGISIKGADGKDAVSINGKDGVGHIGLTGPAGTNGKDGTNAVDISVKNGYNGTDGTNGATGVDGKDGITRIVYEDKSGEHQVATLDDGMKYGGDSGDVIAKKLNNQVNVIGGIKDESKLTSADNIGVVSDGKDNLKVRLAKDLNGITSISNGGNTTITLGDNTVNMNNSTITNVKNGDISEGSTDVVNGGQVYNVTKNLENKINTSTTQLGNRIDRLGTRVNRVGAGAAALAALHPQDFDPDDKWDFAAGYGNYKDASAVAVGAFYRPNEDTMLSVGGSFGGGENMVNAGISVKLGQHSNVTRSRVALAKDVLELKKIVAEQSKMIQQLAAGKGLAAPVQKDVNFPDVPKDHWAYTYVKSLADRGYLEGYPDGEFKGDRTMTRYEYAAIIYRALQNGAPVDADMGRSLGEFGPEIEKVAEADRFRVDRVAGKDNDRNKIERVRVNNKNDKANKVFKDVYGSTIQK